MAGNPAIAPVRVSLDFRPDAARVGFGLEKWASLIGDWRPVWEDVVLLFHRHERRHFDTEGLATGPAFAPLSERYERWKSANYPGRPILELLSHLRDALVSGVGPGAIERITAGGVEVGVDGAKIPYAVAHSRGIGVPRRPPVRLDPSLTNPGAFGWALRQLAQAHVIRARRTALGEPAAAAERTRDRILRSPTR